MKKILILWCIGLIGLCTLSSFVIKEDPLTALLQKLDEYTKKYPQEKVYLHLDKPYYAIGDDIWFKAYVVDSRTTKLTDSSKILYVELINENDVIQRQLKLPMFSGVSWGDFKLTDSLSEGNYRIRAYTQYMRNAGPDFFFDKTIKIGNSWANSVFVRSKNRFSKENNLEKVTAIISFANKDKAPYLGNTVEYEVELGQKKIATGKLTTNNSGEIEIPFVNAQPSQVQTGQIKTTITLPNKDKVVKYIPIKTTSAVTDVQFFPEGGSLVEGLPNRLAIKAVNSYGLGENISGSIVDNQGAEVSQFETTHLGMGSIFFTPLANQEYTAKVNFIDGRTQQFKLPKIEKSGYVLTINNTDSAKMAIRVAISNDLLNKGELKLVGQRNGEVYLATTIQTNKQFTSMVVNKADFASGIVQFTLFSANDVPVCERLAFVNNLNDKIDIEIANLKEIYGKRERINADLVAKHKDAFTKGTFSVAVTNTAAVVPDPENESNILTGLLLTSDLVGYVEKPNFYFLTDDSETRIKLDNLLLTQGWRKIKWQAVLSATPPPLTFKTEKGMNISGVVKTPLGRPIPKAKVSLFSNSNGVLAVDTVASDKGRFNFGPISFKEKVMFRLQAKNQRDKGFNDIEVDMVPEQAITPNKNIADIEVNVNESMADYLNQSDNYFNELVKSGKLEKVIMLDEINVVGDKVQLTSSSNWNGPGKADFVITSKMLGNAYRITNYLRGSVPGLMLTEEGLPYLVRFNGTLNQPQPMAVFVDGMEIDPKELNDIRSVDVESIEVLKSAEYTAKYMGALAGVLVITTKNVLNRNFANFAAGILTYIPKGYYEAREFYSPRYDVKPDEKPDLRTTVYWNPNLVSNEEGSFKLDYFNTDQIGRYRILIEGLDALGNLARKVYTYEVK